ncbi:MAG: hypothetical protein HQ564_08535 [Candidatus Saganbacteria bacterium]|nr:hypothetical protein [Candidatus Saganbacteria bacterium]
MKKIISDFLIVVLNLTFVICNLSLAGEYLLAPNDTLDIKIIGKKDLDTKQTIAQFKIHRKWASGRFSNPSADLYHSA